MNSEKIDNLIGYKIAHHHLVENPVGIIEYVMHGGGIMLRAQNKFFDVALPLVTCDIRGLPKATPRLKMPPLPLAFLDSIIKHARLCRFEVVYYVVHNTENGQLELVVGKAGDAISINDIIDPLPDSQIVAEIHSHHKMEAYFSETDNESNQEFRIFGVIGRTDLSIPHAVFRMGVHGHHFDINAAAIFVASPWQIKETVFDKLHWGDL